MDFIDNLFLAARYHIEIKRINLCLTGLIGLGLMPIRDRREEIP
jgi:hypothetical protein